MGSLGEECGFVYFITSDKTLFYQAINSDKTNFLASKVIFYKKFRKLSFIDDCYELRSYKRGVAQLGSAGALGALGRRFESCRPDSQNPSYRQVSQPVFFIAQLSHIAKGQLQGQLNRYSLMQFMPFNDPQAKRQKEPSKRFIKKQLMKIDFIQDIKTNFRED